MKPILLFVLSVFTTLTTVAQDPALFDTTWYIHKITVDNVETFPPNSSEPIPFDETKFFMNPNTMGTGYCSNYGAEVIYHPVDDTFELQSVVELKGTCNEQANLDFTTLLAYFITVDFEPFGEIIEYEVTTSGGSKSLLLTNSLGDSVLYGNEMLGVADNEQVNVHVYPNPTADVLYIEVGQQEVTDLTIYNLSGSQERSISEVKGNNSIDVQSLKAGVYFIKITNDTGMQLFNKFVKQ
ncbi:T9SS type A sorting domain-containing protein [Rasiella rasia]|uniref:T9SS type A sorting domain-containing protein n=1 Tax=Rasiella rasia TaxID=2744027 RepID=A0A6G6GN33_9FLAO|nr:T9SS type A sorting domain-containing protein [Rasiella rasia]QIE59962.1 T9SS type A sorting domain-containing protein [Rasiella rasia]